MRQNLIVAGILFSIACAGLLAQTPAGKNPIIGTWRLNLEKSKFESGSPPKQQTRQYSQRRDGLIVANIWSTNAQGNPSFTQTVSKYDGKEYGQYNQTTLETFQATGTQTGNTQAFVMVDAYTVDITNKVDGRVATTSRRTVSEDGKTMTHVVKGTNAQDKPYTNVLVFDRVQ
ncbi:MAG TPA: hypothetical protein VER98_19350 [Terriglobia bacterium]|nr:hypothetical protein [Terriglobia bacterium]